MKTRCISILIILFFNSNAVLACDTEKSFYSYTKQNKSLTNEALREMAKTSQMAQAHLGARYFLSEKHGIDIDKAEFWLSKAADNGCKHSIYQLGVLYTYEEFGRKNIKTALELLLRVYDYSSHVNLILGDIYAKGAPGVEKNTTKAIQYFLSEKNLELPEGIFVLGMMYSGWDGVIPDYEKGVYYYKKAAVLGYSDAEYAMGYAFQHGQGVSKDIPKAIEWYEKAKKQKHFKAKMALVMLSSNGEEVELTDEVSKKEFLENVILPSIKSGEVEIEIEMTDDVESK